MRFPQVFFLTTHKMSRQVALIVLIGRAGGLHSGATPPTVDEEGDVVGLSSGGDANNGSTAEGLECSASTSSHQGFELYPTTSAGSVTCKQCAFNQYGSLERRNTKCLG